MKAPFALSAAAIAVMMSGCMIAQDIGGLASKGRLTTPHEAFMAHYSYYVGRDVLPNSVPVDALENEATRKYWGIGSAGFRKLPNGNWELENHLYKGACRIFFEYKPTTRVIVGWRYEGGDENCVQNPYT